MNGILFSGMKGKSVKNWLKKVNRKAIAESWPEVDQRKGQQSTLSPGGS